MSKLTWTDSEKNENVVIAPFKSSFLFIQNSLQSQSQLKYDLIIWLNIIQLKIWFNKKQMESS